MVVIEKELMESEELYLSRPWHWSELYNAAGEPGEAHDIDKVLCSSSQTVWSSISDK